MCDTDEFYELAQERTVKARKPRKCDACKETIIAGQLYIKHEGFFDGSCSSEGSGEGTLFQKASARRSLAHAEPS